MDKFLEDLLDLKNDFIIEITPVEEITSTVVYYENNFSENPDRFCPNCKCEECSKHLKNNL